MKRGTKMSTGIAKRILIIAAILIFAILAGSAFAGTVVVTAIITPGNLSVTMPAEFTLTGLELGAGAEKYSDTSEQSYIVEDARGTGSGWNLVFSISQFKTSGSGSRAIPHGNYEIKLLNSKITKTWGQDIDEAKGPVSLLYDYTGINDNETKAVTVESDYGMGKYDIKVSCRLKIPATTYVGTYAATITAALNSGP